MTRWSLLLIIGLGTSLHAQKTDIVEQVEVVRKILDVRVVDSKGEPIVGLELKDFQLTHNRW